MNVLVIAPHPDDECIGCGGMLSVHQKKGDTVNVIFLTSGELGLRHLPAKKAWAIREAEARKAARILKIKTLFFLRCSDWTLGDDISKASRLLQPLLKKLKPELIYLPHPQDGHPDHQAALPILEGALDKRKFFIPMLRFYEVWTPLPRYDFVQDVSSCMELKLRALKAHKSQLNDFDYVQAVTGLNQYRGALAGKCKFAEVFLEAASDSTNAVASNDPELAAKFHGECPSIRNS